MLVHRKVLICLVEQLISVHFNVLHVDHDTFVALGADPAVYRGLEAKSDSSTHLFHVRVLRK